MFIYNHNQYNNINFITAEKIELIADLILGFPHILNNNPNITVNHPKSRDIDTINSNFNKLG